MSDAQRPKLRPVDVRPISQGGRVALMLRDPLQLSDKTLLMPRELAPFLTLCDGSRDSAGLRASLMVRFGLRVSADVIDRLIGALDEIYLLENERFAEAKVEALAAYRRAPFRPPALAGRSYPADPDELRSLFQGYLDAGDGSGCASSALSHGRGLISPHIDYPRGGPVYAAVWKQAAEMVREADLALILGTDHYGREGALTLTRQNYATPFGVLPTPGALVEVLAESIGVEAAFAEELHHRSEHSIELAANWLHFMRAGRPCQVVPILCGSFGRFVREGAEPGLDVAIGGLVEAIRRAIDRRPAVVVAAADLSHVGPAFGGLPLDITGRARLRATDDLLLERISGGDADRFFDAIREAGDQHNVCGLPPIYLALRLLSPTAGETVAYDHCPADEPGTSLVSVCGVVLR